MKKALSLLVLIMPLFCCTKVGREDVVSFSESLHYNFVTDGKRIFAVKSITKDQILSKLELPADAQILSLQVSYVLGNVFLVSDNAAQGAIIAANVKVGGIEAPIVKETKITLKSAKSGSNIVAADITSLALEGISLLKSIILDWLHQYTAFDAIDITAFAAPDPVNPGKLSVDFNLILVLQRKFYLRHF